MSDAVLGFSLCLHSSLFTMSWQVPLPRFYVPQKMSPNSAALRLTYSFLSDLCPLRLHFIASFAPSQFPSLDFPPCVGYFWFKHFFVRPAGQSHNCYQVLNFPTQQIFSTHYTHTSVKKSVIVFLESLEKAYHKPTIHRKFIKDYKSLSLVFFFFFRFNARLAKFHTVICIRWVFCLTKDFFFLYYDTFVIIHLHLPTVCM